MNKALQALLDTILLAAGAVELGSTVHSPASDPPRTRQRTTQGSSIDHDLPAESAQRAEPPPSAPAGAISNRTSA